MPNFRGTKENSLEDALTAPIDAVGTNQPIRKYFYVTDLDGYSDTEVLVTPHPNGVKVTLPNYIITPESDAAQIITDPTPDAIKETALTLTRNHATASV